MRQYFGSQHPVWWQDSDVMRLQSPLCHIGWFFGTSEKARLPSLPTQGSLHRFSSS